MSHKPVSKRLKTENSNKKTHDSLQSGQFMTSSFDNETPIDVPCPSPIPNVNEPLTSHRLPIFSETNQGDHDRKVGLNGQFLSLYSLLRVINTSYRSNLTSPKWKNFRGSRIEWQDKIRLNNAIWRTWHQQYSRNMKTIFCQFISPLNTLTPPTQLTAQAKQQIVKSLTGEYIKWRRISKLTLSKFDNGISSDEIQNLLGNLGDVNPAKRRIATPPPDPFSILDSFDLLQDQLLFSMTGAFNDRDVEYPFTGLAGNPDLCIPTMGNCPLDFNPMDENFFNTLSNDDFSIRYNHEPIRQSTYTDLPMTNYSNQSVYSMNQVGTTTTGTGNLSHSRPVNILHSNPSNDLNSLAIYNPMPYPQVRPQYERFSSPAPYSPPMNNKPTPSTLENLLHQKRRLPMTTESIPPAKLAKTTKKSTTQPKRSVVQIKNPLEMIVGRCSGQYLQNSNPPMVNHVRSTRKSKAQRSTSEDISASLPPSYSQSATKHSKSTPNDLGLVSNFDLHGDSSPSSTSSGGQNAETKRRQNIQNGFEALRSLIPELNDPSNAKISKAQMLECTARSIEETIRHRDQMRAELQRLVGEKDDLEEKIHQSQSNLPNEGLPMISAGQRSREAAFHLFRRYVNERTRKNWRFYPYSLVLQPIFEQFHSMVTCGSFEEFHRSLNEWKTKYLCLTHLRSVALQAVMQMGKTTSFVTAPERVPDECVRLANQ